MHSGRSIERRYQSAANPSRPTNGVGLLLGNAREQAVCTAKLTPLSVTADVKIMPSVVCLQYGECSETIRCSDNKALL